MQLAGPEPSVDFPAFTCLPVQFPACAGKCSVPTWFGVFGIQVRSQGLRVMHLTCVHPM
jgi:hypothetical protein